MREARIAVEVVEHAAGTRSAFPAKGVEGVLRPRFEKAGQAPGGVVAVVAIAAVQHAQGDLARPFGIYHERQRLSRAQDWRFRLHLAVHEHLKLDAALRTQVVEAEQRFEGREAPGTDVEHDVRGRVIVEGVGPEAFRVSLAVDGDRAAGVVLVAAHLVAGAGGGFRPGQVRGEGDAFPARKLRRAERQVATRVGARSAGTDCFDSPEELAVGCQGRQRNGWKVHDRLDGRALELRLFANEHAISVSPRAGLPGQFGPGSKQVARRFGGAQPKLARRLRAPWLAHRRVLHENQVARESLRQPDGQARLHQVLAFATTGRDGAVLAPHPILPVRFEALQAHDLPIVRRVRAEDVGDAFGQRRAPIEQTVPVHAVGSRQDVVHLDVLEQRANPFLVDGGGPSR